MNGVVFAMTQIASSTHRKPLGLKGRYSLIITLFMGLGLLVIAGTVLSRILYLGNDQVYTLLNTHMQMVASQIDGTFYEAAGLAQQMSPEGTVGKKYYEYITAETHFDRIARSHTLSDDMSNILFSHRKVSLVGYLGPAGSSGRRVTEFMTFPLHANAPDIDTLPTLLTVNGMCFHAIHGSVSALNAKPSISVAKEAHFPGRKRKVYVEFYLDVSDSLRIDGGGSQVSPVNEIEQIIAEVYFFQFLIRFVRPVEKQIDSPHIGIIGARAQPSDGDFCLQLCKDFFLSHEKTPFHLYYRNCGLPSIKEFWYDESCSKASVRVT